MTKKITADADAESGASLAPSRGLARCELCLGTGFYGDMGPGIRGNREYQPCECLTKPEPRTRTLLRSMLHAFDVDYSGTYMKLFDEFLKVHKELMQEQNLPSNSENL